MEGWLITIAQLPIEDPAARMRVLRTLESLGAAVMREGAYLMPDNATNRQALEALAELQSGQVLKVLATDPGAVKDFQAFSRQTGHELVSHNEERKEFTFFMRKK